MCKFVSTRQSWRRLLYPSRQTRLRATDKEWKKTPSPPFLGSQFSSHLICKRIVSRERGVFWKSSTRSGMQAFNQIDVPHWGYAFAYHHNACRFDKRRVIRLFEYRNWRSSKSALGRIVRSIVPASTTLNILITETGTRLFRIFVKNTHFI